MAVTSSPVQVETRGQSTAAPAPGRLSGAMLGWYILWMPLAAIATLSATSIGQFFSTPLVLDLTALLAALAALHTKRVHLDARLRQLSFAALFLVCSTQTIMPAIRAWAPHAQGSDFSAYYIAAKTLDGHLPGGLYCLPRFADGRVNLSVSAPHGTHWSAVAARYRTPTAAPFLYPPPFAVLIRPLAWLPFAFNGVYLAWNALMLVLLGAAVVLTVSAAGLRCSPPLLLILATGVFSTYPIIESLVLGQADILILFLLALTAWLITKHRWAASAVPLCAAALLKVTPLLCVPLLAIHRKWRSLAVFSVCTGILLGFSLWQVGWAAHAEFWRSVLPGIGPGAPAIANLSISAFIQELLLGAVSTSPDKPEIVAHWIILASRIVAGLVYASVLVRILARGRRGDMPSSFAALVLVTLAISPISWIHHYSIALLPLLFLWARGNAVRPWLLLSLWCVVGCNALPLYSSTVSSPIIRLACAAVIPTLAIVVAHAALTPRQEAQPLPDALGA